MGDDITIGVTEIVNNIEVTAQPNDQIVDINVTDNSENVTLNITPTVIEINVNKGSSYARWGSILGTLTDQTDLANALILKADLIDGLVPSYQLPSYVDDVIEVANYAALPASGETGKIYITLDTNHIYRWSGSIYIEITDNTAVWGAITGTLSSQTDLSTALNEKALKTTTISTNAPLSGGGDLSANRTLSISQASASVDGYLSATDWATFNNKQPALGYTPANDARTISTTSPLQGGGDLSASRTLSISQANSTTNGYLSFTDWNTFNGKANDNEVVKLTGDQAIAGLKTFTSAVKAPNFILSGGTGNTGLYYGHTNKVVLANYSVGGGIDFETNGGAINMVLDASANLSVVGSVTASSIIKVGGTSLQFLKADGSVDSTSYQPLLTNPVTASSATANYHAKFTGSGYAIGNSLIWDNGTNVGIGTTAPSYKFNVIGANPTDAGIVSNRLIGLRKENNTLAGYLALLGGDNGDNAKIIGYNSAGTQTFEINASTSATYFNGGNFGIGIVPQGVSTFKTLEIGSRGFMYDNNDNFAFGNNAYNDGSWRYKQTGAAVLMSTDGGGFVFNTAPSGSQGSAFSFTERMRITSGGNVGIGTSSPGQKLVVSAGGTYGFEVALDTSNIVVLQGYNRSTSSYVQMNYDALFHRFSAGGSERMRITSGGNVGIGTTIPSGGIGTTSTGILLDIFDNTAIGNNGGALVLSALGNSSRKLNLGQIRTILTDGTVSSEKGDMIFSTMTSAALSERMRITSGGQVQITQSSQTFSDGLRIISGSSRWTQVISGSNIILGYNESDRGSFNSSTGIYTPVSDINKKKDFEKSTIGLKEILELKPTLYRMKSDDTESDKELGFIAQEVKEFIPQAYVESGEFIGLNFNAIVAALVKSVQEQNVMLQELKSEIEILKNK